MARGVFTAGEQQGSDLFLIDHTIGSSHVGQMSLRYTDERWLALATSCPMNQDIAFGDSSWEIFTTYEEW